MLEPRQLGAAHAGRVQRLEHGAVAEPMSVATSGTLRMRSASSTVSTSRGIRLDWRGSTSSAAGL